MKVLLTWHADPPDPPYWRWITCMDGLMVSLSSIRRHKLDSLTLYGLKRKLSTDSLLVIDSITERLWKNKGIDMQRPQAWILYMQRMLGADILVHKDLPQIDRSLDRSLREKLLKKTIVNAEAALRLADRLGIDVMLVIQGWDPESYEYCAEKYLELGVKYAAIGSLAPRSGAVGEVLNIVKLVRSVLGYSVHLHLLGVSSPRVAYRLRKLVDSIDISTPIRAAAAREIIFIDEKNHVLKRTKLAFVDRDSISLYIVDKSAERIVDKMFESNNGRELVQWLAVLNACTLLRWLKGSSCSIRSEP